jgi:hypothetical protein
MRHLHDILDACSLAGKRKGENKNHGEKISETFGRKSDFPVKTHARKASGHTYIGQKKELP